MSDLEASIYPFEVPEKIFIMVKGLDHADLYDAPWVPITTVKAEALAKLCDVFRKEVFRKAGKTDPELSRGVLEDRGRSV